MKSAPTSEFVFLRLIPNDPLVPGAILLATNVDASTVPSKLILNVLIELSVSKFHFATVAVPFPEICAVYLA